MDSPLDISAEQARSLAQVLRDREGSVTLDKVNNLEWTNYRVLSVLRSDDLHLIDEDGAITKVERDPR